MKSRILLLSIAILAAVAGAYVAENFWLKKNAGTTPAANSNLPVAQDFTLPDLNGKKVSLSDYRGKVVLVNFWATWCAPCLHEIPWLIELHEKYTERGFVVLGVSTQEDDRKGVAAWVNGRTFEVNGQKVPMSYPILLDDNTVSDGFGVFGLPTSLIISRDGRIIKRFIGPASFETFAREIEANL
jgi:cytochrome c biogenesis protein CcmG/thiol:disulfide interchange protein DsbE